MFGGRGVGAIEPPNCEETQLGLAMRSACRVRTLIGLVVVVSTAPKVVAVRRLRAALV